MNILSDHTMLSKRLKERRMQKGLTQAQLAQKAGTTAAIISSYESIDNNVKPSLDIVLNLAQALDVSISWLCGI